MKSVRNLFFAALALAAAFVSAPEARAFQNVLCAPNSMTSVAKRMVNPNTNNAYVLNGQGCAVIAQADIGWFVSQGFSAGPPFGPNILYATGTLPASGTGDIVVGSIPPGAYLQHIVINNLTANAVTGGLSFGTTANGTDIVAAATCAANCLVTVADSALLKRVFSTTAATPIHMAPVTSSNSASLNVTLVYGYF
ncbi:MULTISPECIES: hypothetical protein [unclassified Bradyrhizobium]|uniref:hypothetical protein n=1 Tax=unclassified Bradyrhizobium TaxID=2631580 RepID=UPI0024799D47|nr:MULTISPECIES: hypothetical protein [unclassified Bradyrhizobium]WGR74340.1 hypothetical protein MTX24_16580 [Bradyrhizobium sp. ISRA426]WGR79175.1 hypothetical protein MTX21_01695 [Bradyrhizobium sp. ISRA430]WGR90596.1 hypothetical protein MTX25_39840 [Bradyrhizobium sp. ISRA432]